MPRKDRILIAAVLVVNLTIAYLLFDHAEWRRLMGGTGPSNVEAMAEPPHLQPHLGPQAGNLP
ncbi:MAG TPA: hypothetical protein PLJ12_07500 [Planctomycetota bacterium]|nr:hypothetical protein [Planctomycetota bacterium]